MSTIKRFRPSIESICSYSHCIEPPSTIPCAHCPLIFCLRHLVEHQTAIDNEQKRLLAEIENIRIDLKKVQFQDNRYELFEKIDQWKEKMMENIEKIKDDINRSYQECDREFNFIKENLLNDENENEKNLKEIYNTFEQNLQILQSSRLELLISKIDPILQVIKPNFHSSFCHLQSSISYEIDDHFLSRSEVLFTLDYDPNDTTLYTTSSEYLIFYKSSRSIFQLYNILGQHLHDINYDQINYGDLNQIIWSSYANGFLLATSKQLVKLNCSTKRFGRYSDIGFGFFKDVCSVGESIVLVHHLGTSLGDVIEHYFNNQMIQRCWKVDLYSNEIQMKDTMEIFRIRMSSHLIAIDALFTEKILICDVLQAMKCLFRIETNYSNILSISPIENTKQWILFAIDENDETPQRRMFVINSSKMYEVNCENYLPTNICLFGSNHFILTRTEKDDEENVLFECRKIQMK